MSSFKVIMIGGTSYSGSTMLEMMLANDEAGFSCGEVWSLFMPHKLQQFGPRFPMEDSDPDFWQRILKKGVKNVYRSVADEVSGIQFITDNTKRPTWQNMQASHLREEGHKVKHVLIWKTPEELAPSFHKRKRGNIWMAKWLKYHRQYFSLISEFRCVRYSDLVNNPETLKNLCDYLEIDYFDDKKDYWNKEHYTLFGNKSAKVHLFDTKSEDYSRVTKKMEQGTGETGNDNHRQVKYKTSDASAYADEIERVKASPIYKQTIAMLNAQDINNPVPSTLEFNYLNSIQKAGKMTIFHLFRAATRISLLIFQITGVKIGRKVVTAE
ncbi:MAG: hypothetical protein ACI9EQ_001063 [Bacteroidia bacterium]|jgi:hypothetical protein